MSRSNANVLPEGATRLGPIVAYSWGDAPGPRTILSLLVWHYCDHHLWAGRDAFDADPDSYRFWVPTGVRAHDLITVKTLHVEPSILWPDCCGLHGFIRNGEWIDA